MKTLVTFFILLLSFNALALEWYDLELDQTVTLQKEITFSKENIKLLPGDQFKLYEIINLPMQVSIFQFEVLNCLGADVTTEMIIIDPTNKRAGDPSVGVQLAESCSMEVYVETKDFFTKSLFK